jgi:hypothetical protein
VESLLDKLSLWVEMKFVVNQFPRNSKHVSWLPCEDVHVFLEEFDEREFPIGVQTIDYVSILRRLLCGQWDCLAQ